MASWEIVAPEYKENSGGIRALYRLTEQLQKCGEEARVAPPGYSVWRGAGPRPRDADTIVVYPEVVSGNPRHANRVVRWVLQHPGMLGGDKKYAPGELVVYWSELFRASASHAAGKTLGAGHQVTVGIVDPAQFCLPSRAEPRNVRSVYVGKGPMERGKRIEPRQAAPWPIGHSVVEITRTTPSRADLPKLLQASSDVYVYDFATVLVLEAQACGARVWVPSNGKWAAAPPCGLSAQEQWNDVTGVIRLIRLAKEKWHT